MFILLLLFLLVTLSHALFISLAKSSQVKNKLSLWNIHYFTNGMLWLILLAWVIIIQLTFSNLTFSFFWKLIGLALCLIGCMLIVAAFKKINLKEAMGYRFFTKNQRKWVNSGVYTYLRNPMYDGFVLVLLGLGFLTGITVNFILAGASFLFLNIFLAYIESLPSQLTWRII